MARTLIASDNFDSYANATNLGDTANWLELNNSTDLLRVTNPSGSIGLVYSIAAARAECRWDGSGTFSTSGQYSKATLDNLGLNGGTDRYCGVAVFMQSGTLTSRTYYAMLVHEAATAANRATHLIKVVNNSISDLYAPTTGENWASTDTFALEGVVNGANVDLLLYKNDVLLRTITDSSSPLSGASTKPGITGLAGGDFSPAIASWEGGNVSTGGFSARAYYDMLIG